MTLDKYREQDFVTESAETEAGEEYKRWETVLGQQEAEETSVRMKLLSCIYDHIITKTLCTVERLSTRKLNGSYTVNLSWKRVNLFL